MVHRAQALLLLVVGGLAGAVLAGALLQRNGLPDPVTTRAAQLMAPHSTQLPVRIDIAAPAEKPADASTVAARGSGSQAASEALGPAAGDEAPTTTVVPPTVYSYPAPDRGRGTGTSGGGGGGGGSGGSGSGRGGR